MSEQKNRRRRCLLYRAGPGIGLGHFLVSISVYAQYARHTQREFHLLSRDWLLAIDPSADVDPFFTLFFDLSNLAENNINLSAQKALNSLQMIRNRDCSSVIISNQKFRLRQLRRAFSPSWRRVKTIAGKRLTRMARKVISLADRVAETRRRRDNARKGGDANMQPPRLGTRRGDLFHNTGFLDIKEFRCYLRNSIDYPADYIFVDTVVPFESSESLDLFGRYTPFAPFKAGLSFTGLDGLDFDSFVGIHARHGNGEYLSGRIEGDTPEFASFLNAIETHVRQSTGTSGVIAFSDSPKVVKHFGKTLGAVDISSDGLSDASHVDVFRSLKGAEKHATMSSVLRDMYVLSRCRQVVCGPSLFAVAAYIFSETKKFRVVEQYPATSTYCAAQTAKDRR